MHHIESLWGMLHDLPLLRAPIMPVLSPHIVVWQLVKPMSSNIRMASSRAIDSAQPMSLPAESHPGMSFHAAHWLPITTPMPQFVDALTHMSRSMGGLGFREQGEHGLCKIASCQEQVFQPD